MISLEEQQFNVKLSQGLYNSNLEALREKREERPEYLKRENVGVENVR